MAQYYEMEYDDSVHQLIAALPVEVRLAGLAAEDIVPVLPREVLRAISEEYIRTLPPEVQDAVWRRIDRGSTIT